ncbi:MAG: Rne/Rng family ribonuclease [Armatimonadota bacterium]
MKEIIISVDEFENRVAITENNHLTEYYVSRGDKQSGSIYKGTVTNVLPGMQAAFVDIGLEKNAFLCVDDVVTKFHLDEAEDLETIKEKSKSIKDVLKVKEEILVQVVKESTGSKGNRVTTLVSLPGRYIVLLPFVSYTGISRKIEDEEEKNRLIGIAEKIKPKSMGLIIRTAAEGKSVKDLRNDLAFLLKLWNKINLTAKKKKAPALIHQDLSLVYKIIRDVFVDKVNKLHIDSKDEFDKVKNLLSTIAPSLKNKAKLYTGDTHIFEYFGVEHQIGKALRRRVWLPSGGYIIIDKTEALTVIDVNTGRYIGRDNIGKTILKTNLEAAKEIAHQIRLRDIAGIIIIDFIDMREQKNKDLLLKKLEEHFKEDRVKTNLVGLTELGLVQVTRKRTGKELGEILKEDCPYCTGRGKVISLETLAINLNRLVKRQAQHTDFNDILVKVSPKVALRFIGWEAEDIENLEKETGKNIYLRVDEAIHREKMEVDACSDINVIKGVAFLTAGQQLTVRLEDVYPNNPQNAVAFYKGNIIEVLGGGNKVKDTAEIIITYVSRSYAQAQIKD